MNTRSITRISIARSSLSACHWDAGLPLSNVGFHAPPQHPGIANDGTQGSAGYSNAPWTSNQTSSALSWSSETFAQNQNANAIRWGTLYNFRFDSNRPPQAASATIGFFKTGAPITVAIQAPPSSRVGRDIISVDSAFYSHTAHLLKVRATSSVKSTNRNAPTLRAYVTSTDELIGTLTGNPDGSYGGNFSWPSSPSMITVRSSMGGSAQMPVTVGR